MIRYKIIRFKWSDVQQSDLNDRCKTIRFKWSDVKQSDLNDKMYNNQI
jgi:hypothetical protein